MKPIKLQRREKVRGLYRYYDGFTGEYREFTNYRKYIKSLNEHERRLNLVLNDLVYKDLKELFNLRSPAVQMEEIAKRFEKIALVYRFAERAGANDDYRINNILVGMAKDVGSTREHKKSASIYRRS